MPVDLEPMEWTRITLSLIDGIQSRYFLEIDGMGEDVRRLGSMIVEIRGSGHGMDKS